MGILEKRRRKKKEKEIGRETQTNIEKYTDRQKQTQTERTRAVHKLSPYSPRRF